MAKVYELFEQAIVIFKDEWKHNEYMMKSAEIMDMVLMESKTIEECAVTLGLTKDNTEKLFKDGVHNIKYHAENLLGKNTKPTIHTIRYNYPKLKRTTFIKWLNKTAAVPPIDKAVVMQKLTTDGSFSEIKRLFGIKRGAAIKCLERVKSKFIEETKFIDGLQQYDDSNINEFIFR